MTKPEIDYDVIVVGAGYAGLVATQNMIEKGLRVLALEASDHVGGRTRSQPYPGTDVMVDWGAEWILPDYHHALMALMKRYDIAFEPAKDPSHPRWIIGDKEISGDFHQLLAMRPSLAALMAALEHQAQSYSLTRQELPISLADTIGQLAMNAYDASLMNAAFFPLTGADPTLLSSAMAWNEVRFHGGSLMETLEPKLDGRIAGGTAAVAVKIAEELQHSIRLNHKVSHISDHNDHVLVSGPFGALTAKKCVVALPLRTLSLIEFSPTLSVEQTHLAHEGNVGRTMKLWAHASGIDHPESCHLVGHPFRLTYARHIGEDQYLICAQTLTDDVHDRSNDALIAIFKSLYPNHEIKSVEIKDWTKDELARGSWHSGRVSHAESVPINFGSQGNLTFAGGDYMDPWCGWIEGAVLSGARAAQTVLAKFANSI